jgi:protein TonB
MLFNQTNVNREEWLDLVFENRNQSYGAYVLRKESGNYLLKALLIAISLLILIFVSSAFTDKPSVKIISPISDPLTPEIIKDVELIKNPILKKEAAKKTEISSKKVEDFKTIKYIGNIKPVTEPKIDVQLPTEKDLKNSIISDFEKDGKAITSGTNSSEGKVNSGTETGDGNNGNEILNVNFVEQMPEFPGGMVAWGKFLNKNLNYPSMAKDANVTGRVTVSFVVEKNGEITDVKILRGIGAGCDEEAIRVIKKSPLWKAGIQNGRPVRVSYVMPIVFRLD